MARFGNAVAVAVLALSVVGCAGGQRPKGEGWSCYTSSQPGNYMNARGSGCYREVNECQKDQRTSNTPGTTACQRAPQATCFSWVNGDGSDGWGCYPEAKACAAFRGFTTQFLGTQKALAAARGGGGSGDRWTASACELWN